MTTRAREAIAAEFLRKALAIRAVAVPELDIMENPPPLRYRYFVAQSHISRAFCGKTRLMTAGIPGDKGLHVGRMRRPAH
jgi:hypothetical protein